MEYPKKRVRLFLIIFFLLISLGCLYYYFFIKLDTDWMFWKKNGEDIDWSSIEYDDDFYPKDTVEVYGEYGEWKIKEFKPIYAGYGTTEDDLNYLIGKYLDEDGEEQTVKILVSGEGMVDWMFPDKGFKNFYDAYYKENVAIRGGNYEINFPKQVESSDLEYHQDDEFISLQSYQEYACPKDIVLTAQEASSYSNYDYTKNYAGLIFIEKNNFYKYCSLYRMYYNDEGYSSVLHPFSYVIEELKTGEQFSVKYLESLRTFEECKYNYNDIQKVFCANEYLNEEYEDDFLVAVYIELD